MKKALEELGRHYNLYPIESTQFKIAFEDTVMCPIFLNGFLEKAVELFDVDPKEWFIEIHEINNKLIFGTDAI